MIRQIFSEFYLLSEVWAMLIPMGVLAFCKTEKITLRPVIIFIWLGFFLYSLADFSWRAKEHLKLPNFLNDNNFIYNILSILRVLLFSWYFLLLKQSILKNTKRIIPVAYIAFVIFNFARLENFKNFSNNMHVAESIILLIFTISYFIYILRSDEVHFTHHNSFWIVTGLFVYEAVNFFVFIQYGKISKTDADFAFRLWNVHNVAQVIFCILMAKGLYESGRQRS